MEHPAETPLAAARFHREGLGAIRGVLTVFLIANEGLRMPFSESLAARTRDALVHQRDIAEQKMFGGLCFLLRGNILVGVRGDSLIARIGEEEASRALKKSDVTQMGTRRPMKGWVIIDPHGIDTDRQLTSWIEKAIEFVERLPPK